MQKYNFRNLEIITNLKSGISLISLIITIIVIIILASIVISSGMGTPEKAQLAAVISDINNVQTATDQAYYALYSEKTVLGEVWSKSQYYEAVAKGETDRSKLSGEDLVEIKPNGLVKIVLPNYEGRKWYVAIKDIDENTKVGNVVLSPGFESDGKIYSTISDIKNGGRTEQMVIAKGSGETGGTSFPEGTLSFTSEEVTLVKGGEGVLKLNVEGLKDSDLLWECDNNNVITINQGKIKSKNNGKANVVCKLLSDNNVFAKCTVTVVDGSDMYAEGTGNIDSAPLKFCNIPDDCKAIVNYSYRGVRTEPRHIEHMDELRNSEGFKLKNQEVLERGGFYTDWYYRLEDSFGNTTDYYWFYGDFACFTEQTNISTPRGMKNIKNIAKGDEVYSLNVETKQKEVKKVVQTFKHIVNTEILRVYIGNEYIECTTEHPIYEKSKGWINAIELKAGDILVNEDGDEIKIIKIETSKDDNFVNVYNFEVEDNHNYFVGENKVLVHNPPEPSVCSNEGIKYKGESIGK